MAFGLTVFKTYFEHYKLHKPDQIKLIIKSFFKTDICPFGLLNSHAGADVGGGWVGGGGCVTGG